MKKRKTTENNLDLITSMTQREIILGISFSFGLLSIVLTDGLFSTVKKNEKRRVIISFVVPPALKASLELVSLSLV